MRSSLRLSGHSQHMAGIEPEMAPAVEPEHSPFRFVVRCYAEQRENQWQAFTLELGLAAQGDSFPEAKHKLDQMIGSYLRDALCGEDREYAYELLSRKATWQVYARYYLFSAVLGIVKFFGKPKDHVIYNRPLPLEPKFC